MWALSIPRSAHILFERSIMNPKHELYKGIISLIIAGIIVLLGYAIFLGLS